MKSIYILLLSIVFASSFTSCKVTKNKVSKKEKQQYINGFYQELKEDFPDAEITLIQDSIKVIFPDNIMFDVGSAVWKKTFFEKLIRFSTLFNKYEKTNLLITGHRDNTGEGVDNDRLSKFRADNVKLKMIEYKVLKERLFVWGMGARQPLTENKTEEGKARNRRVEFVVMYQPRH